MRARLVGAEIALDCANESISQCSPSRPTLANNLGVSDATIRRAMAELINGGWLSRAMATARHRTVRYTFLVPGTTRGDVVPFSAGKDPNRGQRSMSPEVVR
ncbi:helix-turn-helix domain-containing protein [Roseovarius indicus]|uniref:helix-turn-helix domain-containing protein n=1 Tax=Roseovarius indicus TaxID=540747 RepID=UPI0009431BAE